MMAKAFHTATGPTGLRDHRCSNEPNIREHRMSSQMKSDVADRIANLPEHLRRHIEVMVEDYGVNAYEDKGNSTEFYRDGEPMFGYSKQLEQDAAAMAKAS